MFFFSNISGSALGQPVRNKPQSIQQRCDIEFLASLGPEGFFGDPWASNLASKH